MTAASLVLGGRSGSLLHEREQSGERSRWIFAATVLILGGCFLLTEHDRSVSKHNDFTLTADDMQHQAGGGNAIRRVAFLTVAGWGLLAAACAHGRSRMAITPLLPAIVFVLGWCLLSLAWSHAPGFTMRRLLVLGCLATGALGLARAVSGADLCRLAIIVCGTSLVLGIANEVVIGTFRPWSGGYRFSGTLHPNTQGLYLTTMCTAAYALVRTRARRVRGSIGAVDQGGMASGGFCSSASLGVDGPHSGPYDRSRPQSALILWAVIVVGLVFLVLTKSRTSTAGVILSLGTLALLRARVHPAALVGCFVGGWWLLGGALVCHLWQIDPLAELKQLLLMGRSDQAESLTGRIPIWTELAPFIANRFWTGYGYDSFWTPDHIDHVSTRVEWGVREAHSAYIETILSIGVIGLGLLLCVVGAGLVQAAWRFRRNAAPACGVAAGLLVYGLLNSFTESGMTMPLFPTFLLGAMLWQVALDGGGGESGSTSRASGAEFRDGFRGV